MTTLYRPQAAALGHPSTTQASGPSLIDAAHEAYLALNRMLGDIGRLRSMIRAMQLAALQDEMAKDGRLYWPDLLATIEALVPNEEPMDRVLGRLLKVAQGLA